MIKRSADRCHSEVVSVGLRPVSQFRGSNAASGGRGGDRNIYAPREIVEAHQIT
jgi:hypothetical protein